jgi:hypothetical protein
VGRAHFAGTERMMNPGCGGANIRIDLGIRVAGGTRSYLGGGKGYERRLRADLAQRRPSSSPRAR